MKKLISIFGLFLTAVLASAQLSNIPIGKMPIAPTLKPSAWIPIIQPYDGRMTNDNFRISSTNIGTVFGTNAPVNTIVVTNLIVVSNLVYLGMTNGLDLWTNIGGVYTPTEAQTRLLANGVTSASFLLTTGSLSDTPTTNALLAIGPNNVNAFQQGTVWIPSPSTDPSTVEVRLSAGNGNGNYLSLFNQGPDGNGFTLFNGSELYNAPGSFVHLHGNWVTTNKYDGLLLKGGDSGWFEVGRMYGNTNFVSGDTLWGNTNDVTFLKPEFGATVRWGGSSSNITMGASDGLVVTHDQAVGEDAYNSRIFAAYDDGANPEDISWEYLFIASGASTALRYQLFAATNYQNPSAPISKFELSLDPRNGYANMTLVNANETTFFVADDSGYGASGLRFLDNTGHYWPQDTNTSAGLWVVDTNNVLQPIDLTWQPMVKRGWVVGTNTLADFGGDIGGLALAQALHVELGEADDAGIWIQSLNTTNNTMGLVSASAKTSGAGWAVIWQTNSDQRQIQFQSGPTSQTISMIDLDGTTRVYFDPVSEDAVATVAHFIDTTNVFAIHPLFAIKNAGTNQLTFGPLAQIGFGQGSTNVIIQDGIYLNYTNGAPYAGYEVTGGDGTVARYTAGGNLASIAGTTGVDLNDSIGGSVNELRWTVNKLIPLSTNSMFGGDWTSAGSAPVGVLNVQTNLVYGYMDWTQTNYSRLNLSHTGTNGAVVFDSQSAGTALKALPTMFTNQSTFVIAGTTNFVTFGATNAAPGTPGTVSKWVSVSISGEATEYRMPLYQ